MPSKAQLLAGSISRTAGSLMVVNSRFSKIVVIVVVVVVIMVLVVVVN